MVKINLGNAKNIVIIGVVALFSGCKGSDKENATNEVKDSVKTEQVVTFTPETLAEEIKKIEQILEDPSAPNKEAERVKLIEFYNSYYSLFASNSLAPEMLFRAGNQSVNLQQYSEALKLYSLVEENYHDYQKRPECIYLQGFIYETYNSELGNAKEKYTYLIERYPKHVLAGQAKISLANMGKTDEELIRQFEKKNALSLGS